MLSWNEIKERAQRFSADWIDASNEEAEAKPFLEAFFQVFGITRRKVAYFEQRVKKLNDTDGYIDLLWKGTILVEMKSRGKDLDKALKQAREYADGLPQEQLPKYILVCDFEHFRLQDIEENVEHQFLLKDLVKNVQHFGYLLGYQKKTYKEQDPANIKAAELMGKLHDRLEEIGYKGHDLEVYLVRILFCLFAEDTTIFTKQQFQDYIENQTREDGSDLASRLQELFQVLNTAKADRFSNLDEQLAEFPYVNGKLFAENLRTASFDAKMRNALLNCCYLDWSKISPAIFGSMFQSVMNPTERRNLGAHYTSEKNILKLIKPLFLDDLWAEFEKVKGNENQLKKFHFKISQLRFLDPACGCGNFLIIAYKELRLLELEIVRILLNGKSVLDIGEYLLLDVDKFYGIEYEEFPAQIAQVAMWLIDHQLNLQASEIFGDYYIRLPLRKSATIAHGNALRIDWQSLLEPQISDVWNKVDVQNLRYDYIMGNPPFVGSKMMTPQQRKEIVLEFENCNNVGILDYVTCWFSRASKYCLKRDTKCAFVSTNSICQGEQVGVLWGYIINKLSISINFAHRTFKWRNEAKGNAAVYCVIIGFSSLELNTKKIYEYLDINGDANATIAKNINGYLLDGKIVSISNRLSTICSAPKMIAGNVAYDYGNYIFSQEEMEIFIKKEPLSKIYFKKLIGGKELINNEIRFCLWLKDIEPQDLRTMKEVVRLVEIVKKERLAAKDLGTHKLALRAHQFRDLNNPKSYIAIPKTSSENRQYIPIAYFDDNFIPSDSIRVVENGTIFHFGILTSTMHMAWVKTVCGRLKSDFRYSKDIVYNNFPWPENPTEKQKEGIEQKAQSVLDIRAKYPSSSLADLYDPLTMPPDLVKAHNELDKAVDAAYRSQPFTSEAKRMEFLFELYEKYTAGLFAVEGTKKSKKK
jgi:type I restriction-modification system DNA methylase subunit